MTWAAGLTMLAGTVGLLLLAAQLKEAQPGAAVALVMVAMTLLVMGVLLLGMSVRPAPSSPKACEPPSKPDSAPVLMTPDELARMITVAVDVHLQSLAMESPPTQPLQKHKRRIARRLARQANRNRSGPTTSS